MQGLGLLILIVGLVLRLRTPVVVLLAAVVTGLCSGMSPLQLLDVLGKAFVDNRILTLFLLTLPAVGLCERYGLRERAAQWVAGLGSESGPGRTLWSYQVFRVLCGIASLRLNGHPTLVRPLLAPMASARALEEQGDQIRAEAAAAENYANFYGQNLSPVAGGVLLVYKILTQAGLNASLWRIVAFASIPAGVSLVLGYVQFHRRRR